MRDCNLAYFTKTQAGKKEGYYRTPDYRIGNRPHTAKFKVVRNERLRSLYLIDSNLRDEIAGQDGVRKWTFLQTWLEKIFRKLSTIKIYEVKYLWGIVKQIQHCLFQEVVKITGPSVLDAWPVIFSTSLNTMLYLYTTKCACLKNLALTSPLTLV